MLFRSEMELFFDVEDQPGSELDLLIELSVDMGVTWNRLGSESLTGSLTGIAPSTGIKLLWDSTLEINEDNHDVRLRVSAINRRGGLFIPAVSDKILVLNDPSNSPPTLSNMKLFAENSEGLSFRDKIEITYDLEDLDGDLSSISLEYSTDGGSNWIQTNNLVGETSALSSGLSKKLTWNSLEDIQHTTSVLIRLIADDGRRGASNTVSECFELCNGNFLPYAQGVRLVGDQDDITISFELVDQDGDSMDIHFEFSVDQATWMTSDEISGPTSGLATGFHEIIWHSLRDLPRNESTVRVRILPSDTGVGFAGISSTNSVLNENYLALISIERARYSHSANIYDNRIFYWGGLSQDGQLLNSLEIFDLNTFTWSRGASGGTPRREHVGIAHSGKLYFWGGRSGTGATINSMDIYDINGDSWSEGLTGGRARRGHSAVVFENKIYFWGGQTSSSELNSMDIYDLEKDSWLEGDSGGTARAEHTGARVGDSIYFWGGLSGQVILDTMDIFNLKTGEWTRGVTGGRARFSHSAVEFEGKIYFYGGFGETGLSDTLDIFDTQSQIWLEGDPGGVGRREHSAIEHQGDIYYFGGVHEAEVINLYETYTINAVSNNSSSNTSNALGWKELSFEVSSGNSHAGIVEDDKIYHYFQNKVDQGSAVEIIDPRTGIREQSIPLTLPISGFATAKSYGRHYFFGGIDSSGNTTDALFKIGRAHV